MFGPKNKIAATILTLAILGTFSLSLAGCGSGAYRDDDNEEPYPTVDQDNSDSTTNWPSTTPNTTVTGDPNFEYNFKLSGPTAVKSLPGVQTYSILTARITAGAGSGNAANAYGCISYTISALGKQWKTKLLSVNGNDPFCPNAPNSQIIDLTDGHRLTPGHEAVVIKVGKALYDKQCLWPQYVPGSWPPTPSSYYLHCSYSGACTCTPHPIMTTDTVTGKIEIQVNGTVGF